MAHVAQSATWSADSGTSPRSQDALIQGCYDRYKATKDKLRACLGK